jgi:hypothetical protein
MSTDNDKEIFAEDIENENDVIVDKPEENRNDDDYITAVEAALKEKCDPQTIKRNIKKGMYPGSYLKIEKSGTKVWMIPKDYFNVATQTIEAVQLTKQISLPELMNALSVLVEKTVEAKIAPLEKKINEISIPKDDLLALTEEMKKLNPKLEIEYLREALKEKSWWQKILEKK